MRIEPSIYLDALMRDFLDWGGKVVIRKFDSPADIAKQVAAEGVKKIVVVSDEPDKYPSGYYASDIEIHHRDDLDAVQRSIEDRGIFMRPLDDLDRQITEGETSRARAARQHSNA